MKTLISFFLTILWSFNILADDVCSDLKKHGYNLSIVYDGGDSEEINLEGDFYVVGKLETITTNDFPLSKKKRCQYMSLEVLSRKDKFFGADAKDKYEGRYRAYIRIPLSSAALVQPAKIGSGLYFSRKNRFNYFQFGNKIDHQANRILKDETKVCF